MDRLRRTDVRRSRNWNNSSKIGSYLANKLLGEKQEQFWGLYFDQQQNLIGEKMLFQGTLDRSWVHPREGFRWAVIYGCANIIVAHNHPSGTLTPSADEDRLSGPLRGGRGRIFEPAGAGPLLMAAAAENQRPFCDAFFRKF